MPLRYVTNADGKGWLKVRHANRSTYPPLPQFLKVDLLERRRGRDHFKILEGRNFGKQASVKAKGAQTSHLGPGSHRDAAKIRFELSSGKLWYGASGPVASTTLASNPVQRGLYDLEIPFEVHKLGTRYASHSPFSTTWFRIGRSGDRFLHPGLLSAGCVTVTELDKWNEIYKYLIRARKDRNSVGTMHVE